MTDLTEKWKSGELEALDELIKLIATVDDNHSLSDEYLKEKGLMTREELDVAAEYPYGIVMATSDYVLPYLKELQAIKQKIHILTESQMKLENTIGELGTENARLKDLLKECQTIISNNLYEFDSDDCSRSCDLIKDIEEALK